MDVPAQLRRPDFGKTELAFEVGRGEYSKYNFGGIQLLKNVFHKILPVWGIHAAYRAAKKLVVLNSHAELKQVNDVVDDLSIFHGVRDKHSHVGGV